MDTICSLRIGIAKNWGHHPQPPDWREWLNRPLLEQCAHHWHYINSVGFAQVRHLAIIKRFELMLQDPLSFAQSVSREIGLDPAAYQSDLTQWARRVQNTNNKDFVEAETSRSYSRPDHTVRIDRWKENLTPADVASIRPIIEQTAGQFGYALD